MNTLNPYIRSTYDDSADNYSVNTLDTTDDPTNTIEATYRIWTQQILGHGRLRNLHQHCHRTNGKRHRGKRQQYVVEQNNKSQKTKELHRHPNEEPEDTLLRHRVQRLEGRACGHYSSPQQTPGDCGQRPVQTPRHTAKITRLFKFRR